MPMTPAVPLPPALCVFSFRFSDCERHRYVDFHIIDAVRHGHSYSTTQKLLYSQESPCISTIDTGMGGHHIYIVLGTGSPILYSCGDPIHIDMGPQTYEGVPISTIDMGMGVSISM